MRETRMARETQRGEQGEVGASPMVLAMQRGDNRAARTRAREVLRASGPERVASADAARAEALLVLRRTGVDKVALLACLGILAVQLLFFFLTVAR